MEEAPSAVLGLQENIDGDVAVDAGDGYGFHIMDNIQCIGYICEESPSAVLGLPPPPSAMQRGNQV